MYFQKEEKIYKSFIISICLIVAVAISGVFLGMTVKTRSLIRDELLSHSRAYFETIVATRLWNATYGGVYVEKKDNVQSNPYMENPDIRTEDGRTFTIRNPATMTREISEYIGKDRDFAFHITSKKLINPNNKPDGFEIKALDAFERGQKEVHEITTINGRKLFRYMGPLYVTKDCLKCHDRQGYKEGEVRGGISVTYNIDATFRKLQTTTILIAVFAFTTIVLIVTILWLLTRRLILKITEIRKTIEELATMDALTKVSNRRFVLQQFEEEFERTKRQGNPFCCIMLDIDHFKAVNDRYGHLAGDDVLTEVAARITKIIRKYDLIGRYGGEEFILVLPDTGIEHAEILAGRINQEIKTTPINNIEVTVSLGVTYYLNTDRSINDIIKRADDRLYDAKKAGRDCVKASALPSKDE
ncbi:MAG: diguanylate cyclase [Thermodesulfovibrio sp.]|nr:diguanylate cyclase [Thermodesulfovibrio sp.]